MAEGLKAQSLSELEAISEMIARQVEEEAARGGLISARVGGTGGGRGSQTARGGGSGPVQMSAATSALAAELDGYIKWVGLVA
jgi:hypothetical protein